MCAYSCTTGEVQSVQFSAAFLPRAFLSRRGSIGLNILRVIVPVVDPIPPSRPFPTRSRNPRPSSALVSLTFSTQFRTRSVFGYDVVPVPAAGCSPPSGGGAPATSGSVLEVCIMCPSRVLLCWLAALLRDNKTENGCLASATEERGDGHTARWR